MRIAMVSDFYHPSPGGVEAHIHQLSLQLLKRNHTVVVITHAYGDRKGIRYLSSGVKIYYIPYLVVYRQATIPTLFLLFPILRYILVREKIEIVHGHASLSSFCQEAILHAKTMGLKAVFTDHSLFGFNEPYAILTNKLLELTLCCVDACICVSHTGKENTTLRANLDPSLVSVIPNALVSKDFSPDPSMADKDHISIIVVSRLFYNKGIDLLVAIVPILCKKYPTLRFIIAGSGPKEVDLEQMRERHTLQSRVQMLGEIAHDRVRDVMVQGNILLQLSLMEAFGTVIVEAASCGLLVVCTAVGGVPEVLPSDMTILAKVEVEDLLRATEVAINRVQAGKVDPWIFHDRVKEMYSWQDVAERTLIVYENVLDRAEVNLQDRLTKYYGRGVWSGKLFCIVAIFDFLIYWLLEVLVPRSKIDIIEEDWAVKAGALGE